MNEIVLGRLDEQEIQTLIPLFQRKTALEELVKILPAENDVLYEKVLKDYSAVRESLVSWWTQIAQHHNWEYKNTDIWRVDINSAEAFLRCES